ncbi:MULTISPECIES: Rho-binding antiterminator [Psychromonas]|uniref:Rho-binding antiterminator n=1 Tax=Psychromonas TaxID=67572 RepID=UPI0004914ADD|nr:MULTISPECIES: Rho-binding antiterminator [Psychromonas]MBB1273567.1 Rho-binding antiterminator [Psychromonas sp. SR45-3]
MINCEHYDTIEIVCMYHYPIKILLKTGKTLEGVAMDTGRNNEREECIKMSIDNVERHIVLETIATLEVTINNPHLDCISFI